jgi:tetratricopeptide (TPR) repeat protein
MSQQRLDCKEKYMRFQLQKPWFWVALSVAIMTCLTGCNTELSRARELLQRQDFLFAAIFYEKALKRDPDDEGALKELTELYCGKLKRVNKCFEKSELLRRRYKKDPKINKWYKDSLLTVAKGLFLEQRLRKATEYLAKYRKLDPKDGKVIFMLGNAIFRLHQKPPFSANDKAQLAKAIGFFKEAISNTKPDTLITSAYDGKKKNVLQWEAYMMMGRVYELYIFQAFKKWRKELAEKQKAAAAKAAKEAKKNKKKRRRRRRRKKKEEKKEEPKFPVNQDHFKKAIEFYAKADAIPQSNKYKRFLPNFRVGMLYANIMRENAKAVVFLHKAEKVDANNASIIGNLKMIYDRLKEQAEKDKDKKLLKKYRTKAAQYDSQIASLRALK